MATITVDNLEKEGWYLSPEGIELVKEELENENCTLKQFIDAAKDVNTYIHIHIHTYIKE